MSTEHRPPVPVSTRHEPHCSDDSIGNRAISDEPVDAGPVGDGGTGLAFWLLILLALAGFGPSMILPAWREYQEAALAEQILAAELASLRSQVDGQRRLLDAIHNDPAVVTRLARRELGYRGPREMVIPVLARAASPAGEASATPIPLASVDPPVPIRRLLPYLPSWNYDALFCRDPFRQIILSLSIGLFVAAFVIFWPRSIPCDARRRAASGTSHGIEPAGVELGSDT